MTWRRHLTKVGLGVAVAVAIAACGSSGGSTTGGSGATAGTTALASSTGYAYGNTPTMNLLHVAGEIMTPKVTGQNVSIDVGTAKQLTFKKGAKLHIAMFVTYGGTQYFNVAEQGAKAAAARFGYSLTVFNADADASTQQQQVQSAINSHQYNAFLFTAVDAALCNQATQAAPAAGILVVTYTAGCAAPSVPDSKLWSPGTLSFTGGATASYGDVYLIAKKLTTEFPGKQDAVLIDGPSVEPAVISDVDAFKKGVASDPDFHLTYMYNAWDPSGGLSDVNAWLSSNPKTTLIVCLSPDALSGCVAGMQQRGLTVGKVPMFTDSGNPTTVSYMKQGWVFATAPYYPGSVAASAVRSLHDAVAGDPVPRVVLNDGHPRESYTLSTPPYLTWVTEKMVKDRQYTPEN